MGDQVVGRSYCRQRAGEMDPCSMASRYQDCINTRSSVRYFAATEERLGDLSDDEIDWLYDFAEQQLSH